MNKIALTVAALLAGASALTSIEANAKPLNGIQMINPAMQPIGAVKPIYAPANPALQPIGGNNPHIIGNCSTGACGPGYHGGGNNWGGGYGNVAIGIGYGVAAGIAHAAVSQDEDCYYVRRRVFVPGVGFIRKRALVCE